MSLARRRLRALVGLVALLLTWLIAAPALAHDPPPGAGAASQDVVELGARRIPLTVPESPDGWVRVRRGALDIRYPRAIESQLAAALAHCAQDAQTVASQLGLDAVPPLEIRLVPDAATMRTYAPPQLPPPAYASGVAYPSIGLALVSATAPATWEVVDVRRVLRHEISHLVLEVATNHVPLPRWFSEGVAVHQSGENSYDRFEHLAMATISGQLAPLRRLDDEFGGSNAQVDIAYAESADFIAYLQRDNESRFVLLVRHLGEGASLDGSTHQTYNASLAQLEIEWRRDLQARFLTAPLWASTGLLWLIGMVLLLAAFVRHRRRRSRTLARWATEEATTEARRAILVVTPGMQSGVVGAGDEGGAQPPIDPRSLN